MGGRAPSGCEAREQGGCAVDMWADVRGNCGLLRGTKGGKGADERLRGGARGRIGGWLGEWLGGLVCSGVADLRSSRGTF